MDQGLISTKLRSVITLVDKLRDINLESYIKLPKIVAVGSQSSGKSSLVQQIVGLDFLPRGSGVVTRRPLQIRMVYQKDLKQPYAQFAQIPQKMTNFNKVKQSIQFLTDKICGKRKNIIDKPIILDIYSANCPNLTIIDLPGLTRIPIDGQDENILQVTTKMIRKYMQQPSTIILCVIPANQDLTNDEVLHLARKVDVNGERTIGCITKIDIMDRGTDARNLLLNKQVSLKLGYVGIKNRSQADINQKKTVQQSIEAQKMYFSKSPVYSSLPTQCLGTTSLVNKMTKVLTQNICRFLPELIEKIKERKAQLSQLVKSYGRPLPKTAQQKQSLLWQMCSQFINEYKKCLVGQISILKCQQKLLKTSCHIQNELYECLDEQASLKIQQILEDGKIQFALRKFQGANMPGFPSISAFLYLLHPLIHALKSPIQLTLNNVFDSLMHLVQLICTQIAHQYIELRQHITDKINSILNRYRRQSRQFIQSLMQCETGYIYTNNPSYNEFMEQDGHNKKMNKNPMVDILRKRINAYYRVLIRNLRDLAPKNIKYSLIVEATKTIQFQIFQLVNQGNKIDEFLKVGEASKSERMKNQQEYQILCKAEQFVLTHSGLSGYRDIDNKKRIIMRQQQIEQINKKRQQKEAEKQQKKKIDQQSNAKIKEQQQNNDKKFVQTPTTKIDNKNLDSSPGTIGSFFDNFFSKKPEPQKQAHKQTPKSNPTTAANTTNNSPQNKTDQSGHNKNPASFQDIFGIGAKKPTTQVPPPITPTARQDHQKLNKNFTDTYNKQMGKATDKAVDNLYANEQFKQKSKQAVAEGASLAAQKKFGVSQETGKTIGKGAAWMFGQDITQNYLKQQTKNNIKQQTQIPPK